ncbi:LAME_0F03928g1_1 [Lachancea meyersii CBS 8951]|uniref:histidine kinase n=1 Tax=Lachancea meyersii CBS 8951 TaxID=1266667 RepID=A0A1G4JRN2_9SACH|nr:LAME_0F03928g1_1 [Lachancea meyersii CBS 8951]
MLATQRAALVEFLRRKTKPPFTVSIRAQLTALVCLVAIFSLIILAVITGVYFTSTYKSLRADRLQVASQLKASQIDQNINFLYYQCYWMASRDILQNALTEYLAGNTSKENWYDAATSLDKFLSSSNLFSAARVYDSSFKDVLNATNNGTGNLIPEDVLTRLFPLSTNDALPSSLRESGYLSDPVLNGTDTYLMSMSLPILANPSIILSDDLVYGYLTVVMSADNLKSVYNSTAALDNSAVVIVSTVYENSTLMGFHLVFPPYSLDPDVINYLFDFELAPFLKDALLENKNGSIKSCEFLGSKNVAIGYSSCSFEIGSWAALIVQPESVFLSPSFKLTKIIIGTVIGIAVVMCLITFPLSHWAVQPIVRLQKATEVITAGRGLKSDGSTLYSHKRTSTAESLHSLYQAGSIRRSGSLTRTNGSRHDYDGGIKGALSGEGLREGMEKISEGPNELRNFRSATSGSILSDSRFTGTDHFNTSHLVEVRVPVYKRYFTDELSELTETFNAMTDELDRHYALLEDRVRARTRQLEAAKIEAEKANEAKTVFIANISHELRTPLNGILGMTAIAMAEEEMSKVKSSLKLIFRSGELLLHIMTELLTFSKNVLKRTKLEERDFTVHDLALQVDSIFGKLAKDQHVRLNISIVPNVLRTMMLWGDSNRIVQIIMNLVSNALKFTPVDGKVDVKISLVGEYDEERSKLDNFKAVYTLPHESSSVVKSKQDGIDAKKAMPMSASSGSLSSSPFVQDNLNDDSEKLKATDLHVNERSSSSHDDSSYSKEMEPADAENLDDDIKSTESESSCNSYDGTRFQSQFLKDNNLGCNDDFKNVRELKEPKKWIISMEVKDTGPGIEPTLQESVFEPFVQGDQTLSRQYGGTGLGLSICRQLATMMHGTMKLESKVGIGSKFIFTVPLMQTKEISFEGVENPFEDEFNPKSKKNRKVKFKVNKPGEEHSPGTSSSTNDSSLKASNVSESEVSVGSVRVDRPFLQSTGTALSSSHAVPLATKSNECKVLVAEDNNVNQEVIKRMLNLEGLYNVDLACDGQDAIEKVRAENEAGKHYDLIFMDVQMPRVDGLSATKKIRGDLNYKHPIVALTAYADDKNIKECLDAGMNGFLSKPIRRPKIKSILDDYCPQHRPESEGD